MQRPMAISERRMPELGRIRMGAKRTTKNKAGKEITFPTSLETWRLTSPSRERLLAAVQLGWGEEVQPWQSPGGPQWELYTTLSEINVVVPPWSSFSRFYEQWGSNLLARRCDGMNILESSEESDIGRPCICMDPDQNVPDKCPLVTRLQVIIPELPGFGVWRFETHGINSSIEMAAIVPFLEKLSCERTMVNCVLSIVSQSSRDKTTGQTRRYKVGTIQPRHATMLELVAGMVPDSALAIPRTPDRKQIQAAMGDLGYGDEDIPVQHHSMIGDRMRESEPNPFAPGGEYEHISAPAQGRPEATIVPEVDDPDGSLAEMLRQCDSLLSFVGDERFVSDLLTQIFHGKPATRESLAKVPVAGRARVLRVLRHCVQEIKRTHMPPAGRLPEWVQEERKRIESMTVPAGDGDKAKTEALSLEG